MASVGFETSVGNRKGELVCKSAIRVGKQTLDVRSAGEAKWRQRCDGQSNRHLPVKAFESAICHGLFDVSLESKGGSGARWSLELQY